MKIDNLTDQLWHVRDSDKATKADFKEALERAFETLDGERNAILHKRLNEYTDSYCSAKKELRQLTAQLAAARDALLAVKFSVTETGDCNSRSLLEKVHQVLATPSPAADALLQDRERAIELLKESREYIAACFRAMSLSNDVMQIEKLEIQLRLAGLKDGIGVRLQDFIAARQVKATQEEAEFDDNPTHHEGNPADYGDS